MRTTGLSRYVVACLALGLELARLAVDDYILFRMRGIFQHLEGFGWVLGFFTL